MLNLSFWYFQVNGKNLENLPHNEAVKIFLSAGNVVKLKVQHGALDKLMVSNFCQNCVWVNDKWKWKDLFFVY